MNHIEADQGRAQQVINLVFEFTDRYISPKEARQIDTLCQKRIEQVFEEIEKERFTEPQHIPQAGREPIIICLTEETLQNIKAKIKEE